MPPSSTPSVRDPAISRTEECWSATQGEASSARAGGALSPLQLTMRATSAHRIRGWNGTDTTM